ncbi:MAG: hypothetical protein ACPL68_04680 [Candidatus Hydrothermia bacterium]
MRKLHQPRINWGVLAYAYGSQGNRFRARPLVNSDKVVIAYWFGGGALCPRERVLRGPLKNLATRAFPQDSLPAMIRLPDGDQRQTEIFQGFQGIKNKDKAHRNKSLRALEVRQNAKPIRRVYRINVSLISLLSAP